MILKYDSYYEKEIPYLMDMEEIENFEYISDQMILAIMRKIGRKNLRFCTTVTKPSKIFFHGHVLPGMPEEVKSICRMIDIDDAMYNPLCEYDCLRENHWYHPYKIKLISTEFRCSPEIYYFSDFCSLVMREQIQILDISNIGENYEKTESKS